MKWHPTIPKPCRCTDRCCCAVPRPLRRTKTAAPPASCSTEAQNAAQRLGQDSNLRWTAFGPTNAKLHRVHIAVALGDAGTALDAARTVDLDKIDVTERKAAFLVDTTRAFMQYGKYEHAYFALRAAGQIAPEEIAGRPAVHQIALDLAARVRPASGGRPGSSPPRARHRPDESDPLAS